jgi:hypothetical protein
MEMNPCKCGGIPFTFKAGLYWLVTCQQCPRYAVDSDEYDVIEIWNKEQEIENED